jgi:sugar lactone lactonase YvrE
MQKALFAVVCVLAAGLAIEPGAARQQGNDAAEKSAAAKTAEELNAEAVQAYQAKDYGKFLELEKRALELNPANPRILYNVACGESLGGNAGEAVRRLEQLAIDWKLDLGAEADTDFAGIRGTPEWKEYEAKLAELRKPMVRGRVAFTLKDPQLVATGIAVDGKTGDTYVASVRERKIVKRTKSGQVSDFIAEGQDGFLAGASLLLDAKRGLLYASTAGVPFMRKYEKGDEEKSGVFAFDLKTGKTVRKVWLAADGKAHFLNALVMDRAGNVYVSDSLRAGIYRLRQGAQELEAFASAGFRSTQGLAFSHDEKTLYVADYSNGLWALDMATKEQRRIEGPPNAWLGNLDGLARVKDAFICVQIQVTPARVVRLRLDAKGERIASVETLERNRPDYNEPIQGTVSDGAFFYVANSQLTLGNGRTGEFAAERAKPTVVVRLPL